MRRALAALLVLAALAVPGRPAAANPHVVVAVGSVFVLPETVIVQGQGLTLHNLDGDAHNVISDDGYFDSETITQGSTDVRRVASLEPGTYPFSCTVHPGMIGQLTVV